VSDVTSAIEAVVALRTAIGRFEYARRYGLDCDAETYLLMRETAERMARAAEKLAKLAKEPT
jgi:hypothetical protein